MEITNKPLISILMPVYNSSKYLREALDSVLNQTYQNWELIAVDDKSTDDCYSILLEYSKKDPRIRVFQNKENSGILNSLNRAKKESNGEFISRFDSDDIMPRNRLDAQLKFLLNNPDVVAVGGQIMLIDEAGSKIGMKKFPTDYEKIYKGMFTFMTVQDGSLLVNSSLVPSNIEWFEEVSGNSKGADGVDFVFKLMQYGKIANLKKCISYYRQYPQSNSTSLSKVYFFVTFKTRLYAIKNYGYKPTVLGYIINFTQFLIVPFIPQKLIYPIFMSVRMFKEYYTYLLRKLKFKYKIFIR